MRSGGVLSALTGAMAGLICAAQTAAAQTPYLKAPVAPALAVQSPWYLEGAAGAFWRMDASRSATFRNLDTGARGPGTNTTTFDPGPIVFLGLGYRLPAGFRIEGELGYAHYASATVNPLSTDGTFPLLNGRTLSLQSGGGYNRYSAMVDGFYDFPRFGWAVPYVGLGVGAVYTQSQQAHFTSPDGTVGFTQFPGNSTHAAIAAEAGLAFALDPKWSVVPAYRFEHVFTTGNAFPNDANIFKLGFRYSM